MPRFDDRITRRDFLDGVAISAAGLAAAAASPHLTGAEAALAAREYPPTDTGLKGEPDGAIRDILRIDGLPNPDDPHSTEGGPGIRAHRVRETGERYDCVIVGAGASGLASAKWYRDRFGPRSKILLIDPLPDFGGHATRNEFHVRDVLMLRNGGAVNMDSIGTWNRPAGPLLDIPGAYGQPALDLLAFLGVDTANFPSTAGPGIPSSHGLRSMLLFPSRDWGRDTVTRGHFEPDTPEGWAAYVDRLPYSRAAKDAIVRIQTDTTDWLAPRSRDEKIQLLTRLTYKRYLTEYAGAPEEAIVEYQRASHGLFGTGAQAVSAADMWLLGEPGFQGLDLGDPTDLAFPGIGRTPQMNAMSNSGPTRLWPDGNASLVRLLVSRLIPRAFAGRPDQETIVAAPADYRQLDRPGNDVRIRLRSLVFRVQPGSRPGRPALIDYKDARGRAHRVRATHVVMACWNRVTAHIVDRLPAEQVEHLCYARKVPLIYGRAGLRNWRAFADAKISSISPRGRSLFWDSTSLSAGARFGSTYGPTPNAPDQPATLGFSVVPGDPDATPQLAAYETGRQALLEMSFRDLEDALIDVIDRTVNASGGDFEPRRDIHSIMINRWNYGYAHEYTSVWDPCAYGPNAECPNVKGRVPFRNVAIANSDAAAFAYVHAAIDEGYRAVQELPDWR